MRAGGLVQWLFGQCPNELLYFYVGASLSSMGLLKGPVYFCKDSKCEFCECCGGKNVDIDELSLFISSDNECKSMWKALLAHVNVHVHTLESRLWCKLCTTTHYYYEAGPSQDEAGWRRG